jgi:streptomycin 6-kinase
VDVRELATDVRARFEAAIAAWRLADLQPVGGGAIAVVCAATRAGEPVVLKVNPRGHRDDRQLAGEGLALRFWSPSGAAPRLLDTREDGLTLLMERLTPGTALDETGLTWDERLPVLGHLAARLHACAPPPGGCISMHDFVADWRATLAADPALLAELEELAAPADDDVLIHADLHGGNALLHGSEWKAIDPKGVRGDRHADVWALLDPDVPPLPPGPGAAWRRVEAYAAAAGLDPQRAGAWTRVRALAEASWIKDPAWAARLRALADALS